MADVDALVKKDSAIDRDAQHNTTSVYTAAQIFPMLPLKLSTNLTSLNLNQDRLAIVVDMAIAPDGSLIESDVYRAVVRNHAKLAYNSIAEWLEGKTPMPAAVAALDGLAENLLLQDRVAQMMKSLRHTQGALSLETMEAKTVATATGWIYDKRQFRYLAALGTKIEDASRLRISNDRVAYRNTVFQKAHRIPVELLQVRAQSIALVENAYNEHNQQLIRMRK